MLCGFFGQEHSNENLFPMMISFLNSYEFDDWKLRSTFFQHITDVLRNPTETETDSSGRPLVDAEEMTSTLLPCIEDGLRDSQEIVVESAFQCLIKITKHNTLTTSTTAAAATAAAAAATAAAAAAATTTAAATTAAAAATTAATTLLNTKREALTSLVDSVVPFVLHPIASLRSSAVEFLSEILYQSDIGIARKWTLFTNCDPVHKKNLH